MKNKQKNIILTELKYKLNKFTVKDNKFIFRCPYCGDSQKSKKKARGALIERHNGYFYTCFNCSVSQSFKKFIKYIDPILANKFIFDMFLEKPKREDDTKKIEDILKSSQIDLTDLNIHELSGEFLSYIKNRKIPEMHWKSIKYTDDFNSVYRKYYKNATINFYNSRLLIELRDKWNNLIGYQTRSIDNSPMRYLILLEDSKSKQWGLNNLNDSKHFYITEGIFDAMFLPNSCASLDLNLIQFAKKHNLNLRNATFIFDNELKNKRVKLLLNQAIDMGLNVFIWPKRYKGIIKDLNDLILYEDNINIKSFVDENTFSGLLAKLKV